MGSEAGKEKTNETDTKSGKIWLIRYRDGHLESAGMNLEEARRRAAEKASMHGGIEIII